ncbi:class I SAM-dependent methyltransferase [Aeromicrobium stalagmiti]|uniref:class I SAM-dependent methyltransferase n=1 Tax=Aeromicrobium stalagmiti TaxID=2738988 RepID=UPI0015696297|nr:class I SAM-dependent methyltransferase [Aeromicrobium stalagmiti]NRQ49356.1 class I SAM-dependent methyltransferase [Aeromicrobium stalagmiti]
MNDSPEDRTAKWLVGDRLSCVLHLGDGALAYQLAEQGHEVVVAGDDVTSSRHPDIQYVRSAGERLPFLGDAFDVVVAPELREAPTALAEYARVLRPDGLLSAISQRHDDSIPWMRKLREITGSLDRGAAPVDTFGASGLFHEPETHEFGTWEKLDLPGLLRFAQATKHPSVGEAALAQVRDLFMSYGGQTGFLRLRHETFCVRARVDKAGLSQETPPPDTMLLDFR